MADKPLIINTSTQADEVELFTIYLKRAYIEDMYNPATIEFVEDFLDHHAKKMLHYFSMTPERVVPPLPDDIQIRAYVLLYDSREKIPINPIDFFITTRIYVFNKEDFIYHPSISNQFYDNEDEEDEEDNQPKRCSDERVIKGIRTPYHGYKTRKNFEQIAVKIWLQEIDRIEAQIQRILAELFPIANNDGKMIRVVHPNCFFR